MGSLHDIVSCVLGELGRFREKNGFREPLQEPVPIDSEVWIGSRVPRSGNWFREPFDGLR